LCGRLALVGSWSPAARGVSSCCTSRSSMANTSRPGRTLGRRVWPPGRAPAGSSGGVESWPPRPLC